jgi:hypothetical protein
MHIQTHIVLQCDVFCNRDVENILTHVDTCRYPHTQSPVSPPMTLKGAPAHHPPPAAPPLAPTHAAKAIRSQIYSLGKTLRLLMAEDALLLLLGKTCGALLMRRGLVAAVAVPVVLLCQELLISVLLLPLRNVTRPIAPSTRMWVVNNRTWHCHPESARRQMNTQLTKTQSLHVLHSCLTRRRCTTGLLRLRRATPWRLTSACSRQPPCKFRRVRVVCRVVQCSETWVVCSMQSSAVQCG